MSETNLSNGTETSDESSGSGDGDNIVLQVAYYQQSQHQTRTQLIRSQVLQIILVTEWFARFLL